MSQSEFCSQQELPRKVLLWNQIPGNVEVGATLAQDEQATSQAGIRNLKHYPQGNDFVGMKISEPRGLWKLVLFFSRTCRDQEI